jgi:hypothetical protein
MTIGMWKKEKKRKKRKKRKKMQERDPDRISQSTYYSPFSLVY